MDATTESALDRWFAERVPAMGELEPASLLAIVDELSARTDLWAAFVRHDERSRVYTRIHHDHVLDAWLICWSEKVATAVASDRQRSAVSSGACADSQPETVSTIISPGRLTQTSNTSGGSRY